MTPYIGKLYWKKMQITYLKCDYGDGYVIQIGIPFAICDPSLDIYNESGMVNERLLVAMQIKFYQAGLPVKTTDWVNVYSDANVIRVVYRTTGTAKELNRWLGYHSTII